MSRFKNCEIVGCEEKVSRANPHVVKLVSVDEGMGRFHGHIPNSGKCPCCNDEITIKMKAIKLKICNYCYQDFKDGVIGFMHVSGLDRKLESFDPRKNIAYYALATKEDKENNDINDTDYNNGNNGRMVNQSTTWE
jgi:hypothetical protein